jgi:hypothetical protein
MNIRDELVQVYLCSRNYRQGKTACNLKMIKKEYLEKTVINEIKKRVLNDDNLEGLRRLLMRILQPHLKISGNSWLASIMKQMT